MIRVFVCMLGLAACGDDFLSPDLFRIEGEFAAENRCREKAAAKNDRCLGGCSSVANATERMDCNGRCYSSFSSQRDTCNGH